MGHALHYHQCQGACHNLQCAARQMDGGAKWDDESGNIGRDTVLPTLLQCYRDSGGTGLSAQAVK